VAGSAQNESLVLFNGFERRERAGRVFWWHERQVVLEQVALKAVKPGDHLGIGENAGQWMVRVR
jgi:hypothetical protein